MGFKRILVASDFSETSLHAFDRAVSLAGWGQASVRALHVRARGAEPSGPAEEELGRLEERAAGSGVELETVGRAGRPAATILDEVERSEADLLVVGLPPGTGNRRGRVAEQLLRRSPVSVLAVPGAAEAADAIPGTILCAVDFSEASLGALDRALGLAARACARVVLLHVTDRPRARPVSPRFTVYPGYAQLQQRSRDRLRWLVPTDARAWSRPWEEVSVGDPGSEIVDAALRDDAHLIVMGSVGHRAGRRPRLGSTTRWVTREAWCPVLVVPSPTRTLREPARQRGARVWSRT